MFAQIARGVARNTSIMFLQQAVTWGSTFVLMLIMPRYLGPVEFGWLFLAISITQIFRVIVEYGGNYLVAKNVARSPERSAQILVDALGFRTALGVVSIVLIVAFTFLAGYSATLRLIIFIYAIGLLWQGAITALYATYQGREMMQYTSIGAIAERVFNSIAVITAILLGANVVVLAVLFVIGGFMQFIALAGFRKRIVPSFPRIDWAETSAQIRDGLPYFLFAVFSMVYYRIDSVMLSKMSPAADVGWYGGAFRFFETMQFFPVIFSTAIYPVLSRLWTDETHAHTRAIQKSVEFMIMIGIPIAIGLVGFSRDIIQLFYGLSQFGPAVPVLQVLSAGLLVVCIDIVLGTTLLSSDRQKQQSIVALCAIPAKLGLNFVLINYSQARYGNGALGAAVSTVLVEAGIMVCFLFLVPRGVFNEFPYRPIGKALVAGTLMGGVILLGRLLGFQWVGAAVLSLAVYGVVLVLARALEPPEIEFFRSFFTMKNLKRARSILGLARSNSA
ncbi:MAG TPA: flippase [Bacteroidota bacterium]|nr:flippase [Bacteroidota bacterium]